MKMTEEHTRKIQEIIGAMRCPKNFRCAEGGFEGLCRARDFGDDEALQCLDETSPPCPFARVYDSGFQMRFCRCPLRVYLSKNLGR